MASTNVRLMGSAPWLPPVTSKRSGFSGVLGPIAKNSARTGLPVTTPLPPSPRAVTAYPVAIRLERRASTLLVNPGSAFGSKITLGMPRSQVASIIGPAAYPPTPKAATGRCLRTIEKASIVPGPSIKKFFTSVRPPLPLSPAARRVSSGSPAWGTSFISMPRCVPTSTTSLSLPRESHSRAIAMAGNTWPPVPPPAISSFMIRIRARILRRSSVGRLLRDIQQHSRSQQHHQQTRSAVADKRQRDSFGRNHAQHHRKIDERLEHHHRGNAQRQQAAKIVRSGERRTQPAPAVDCKQCDHHERSDETQLFAD